MTDRSAQMFAAIYTALSGDATLTTLLGGAGRVFNGVAAGQAEPYVDIGDTTAVNYRTSSGDAQEHTVTLHVWTAQPVSGGSARLQCLNIMARVRDLLHYVPLQMSAGNMANLICEFSETMRDTDPGGLYWHGVLRFRAVTEN